MRPSASVRSSNSARGYQSPSSGLLRRHKPDYVLLVLCAVLLVVGLITIYAISPGLAASNNVSASYYVIKQLIAIAIGVVGFILVAYLPLNIWGKYLKYLVGISLVSALAVRFVGQRVNGAYRWIQIGGFSFQAVELIKFTVLIWLAAFLARRVMEGSIRNTRQTLKPLLIVLIVVGVVVAGLESDLGSTGVIVVMMAVMCFVAGLPLKKVAIIGGIVAIGLILAIGSSSYRRERLLTFLHPAQNCQTTGTGYQACQAMIAVGSGGLFGKGLAKGVQDYGYLPETYNDSIFAVYAEQFGFVGSAILLGIFLALFRRIKNIMERAPDQFSRFVVAGVLAWLGAQTLINIGAMIGLLPLKGITLPLISYGGTSIVFVMVAIGLVFNISYYTNTRLIESDEQARGYSDENTAMRGRHRRAYYAHLGNRA
ncbi:MAG TPA: putative peptidoglycan glycosyltransferase FtsW [Candidatus Saccharimonadales bacterium]|nr:putative peptidoglycan glycosyltransferase FtsW [Candidatus Saccharimonadales bacterium]